MHAERTQREDIVHFLNSAFACTGQREFYENAHAQRVSIEFLHQYMLVNYRSIYLRSLAIGINHFNTAQVILNLLATGRDALPGEGALVAQALAKLPPQRAWKALRDLRRRGISNRRARAIALGYLNGRDLAFDCVKYGNAVKAVVSHLHLKLPGEAGVFLFGKGTARFETPLFETVRQARHSAEAVYDLPFTVAEGFAARHRIPRETFLTRIEPRMTQAEKLRLQRSAGATIDLRRSPLTKLALYALSLKDPDYSTFEALEQAARGVLRRTPLHLGKVAAVLDNSYSTSGSLEKKRRPLGIAWGVDRLLAAASSEYRAFWTHRFDGPRPAARGATDLATPILDALATAPDLLVIVSDAVENNPPDAASGVLRLYRTKLDPRCRTTIIHLNPVFTASDYAPRSFCAEVPTVGLRDAESLPTALSFARFAAGNVTRDELEDYLDGRVAEYLGTGTGEEAANAE